jgi:hypothetical protein
MPEKALKLGDWQTVIDAHPLESHDPAEWLRYGVALLLTLTPGAEAGKQQQQAALAFVKAEEEGASAETVRAAQQRAVLLGLNEALIAAGMQELNDFNTPSRSDTVINEPAYLAKPTTRTEPSNQNIPRKEIKTLSIFKPQQIQEPSNSCSTFTGVSQEQPLKINWEGEKKVLVLHLDQAELISDILIETTTCKGFKITIDNSPRHGEYQYVCEGIFPRRETPGIDSINPTAEALQHFWSDRLRFTIETANQPSTLPATQSIEIKLLVVDKEYETRCLAADIAGKLYTASTNAPERKDSLLSTENIDSGKVIEALENLVTAENLRNSWPPIKRLFPEIVEQKSNLLGEKIGDGISMYVCVMNRNNNIEKNLSNWLRLNFNELVILDWSTDGGMTHVKGVFDDPRVRLVRVEEQSKYVRTIAQNLATRICRNNRIFKCDSDVEFKGDFFAAHKLKPSIFWVGDWRQARDFNERHLCGETYYWLEDFLRIGGYDERIKSYGHDDTNLKDRMLLSGLKKSVFNYDYMYHQPHEQLIRAQGSHGIHPMVANYANKLMTKIHPLWSSNSDHSTFELVDTSKGARYIRLYLKHQPSELTDQSCIEDALRIVGAWYEKPEVLTSMTSEQIHELIWEKQIE